MPDLLTGMTIAANLFVPRWPLQYKIDHQCCSKQYARLVAGSLAAMFSGSMPVGRQSIPMDFADACLVLLGEKMNISKVVTIDRDFDIYKLKGKRSFTTCIE
jgi:hypothetical protein